MRTRPIVWIALCAFVMATGIATGQPPGPPPHHPEGPPPDFEESRELMEQVMMTRLSRRLGLNDEQSLMLMRRFADVRERQQALRRERMEVLHELREVIREERDEAALQRLMAKLEDVDNRTTAALHETREAIGGLDLDVWQKAKLTLFLSEFDGEMRRVLQQVRGDRPGPHGPMMDGRGRPGPPFGPMMDDPDRPRPPGEAMRQRREGRPQDGQEPRPQRMPNRPRRQQPEAPPAE